MELGELSASIREATVVVTVARAAAGPVVPVVVVVATQVERVLVQILLLTSTGTETA
jgi:hypothetical protein